MGSVVLLDRVYALSADVLERAMFFATSSGPILVLLCDTRPVPVYYCETPMDSPLTALETFDPARGYPGVAFGTRSVVKLDYSILVRLALTGVTGGMGSWQCVCSRERHNGERVIWSTTFSLSVSLVTVGNCPLLRARSLRFPPGPGTCTRSNSSGVSALTVRILGVHFGAERTRQSACLGSGAQGESLQQLSAVPD
jgi:hypothetical protein